MRRLTFLSTLAVIALNATSLFADGIYEGRNVDLSEGAVRVGRSGAPAFEDNFATSEAWATVANYRDLLKIEFGKEINGSSALVVSREKPIDENDPEGKDTAWGVETALQKIALENANKEFVLRVETLGSKNVEGGGSDGESYRGALDWYDAEEKKIATVPFLFRADVALSEKSVAGVAPEGAVAYKIRLGFDVPNLEPGEFVVVKKLSFEFIQEDKPYLQPASFVSGVFEGGAFSWNADVPEGSVVKFQVATAPLVGEEPGEFSEFVGPNGTNATYYEEPFGVDAPFARYRVVLISNGQESPVLKSVVVGDKVDSKWRFGGVNDPPRVKIVGAYATPNPNSREEIAFEVCDASIVKRSSIKILLDDGEATDSFSCAKNGSGSFRFAATPEKDLEPGLHKLQVEAADVYGNSYLSTRCFLVGEPSNTPQITLREDGMTLIDGEPFFPIGIYGVMKREFNGFNIDEAFRGLKEAGFNFAHSYSMPREDEFLAAAEKYGFKLWSVARLPDERFVDVERFSPAIISWYLGDDTSYNTKPEELYDYHDSVKAVDPSRLTVQADPIDAGKEVSNYRPYVEGTDAFLPETYPVRRGGFESGKDCVAQAVRDVKRSRSDAIEAQDGPKAIWPIIQYFKGWGWERFPTYRELRAMSFGAIAAGANGITWYTYGGTVEPELKKFNYGVTTTPERWNNISKIATQINELSPVLLQQTDVSLQPKAVILNGAKTNVYGEENVVCLLKRYEGKNYLIAVNCAPEPIDVKFEFAESLDDASTVEVLYDEAGVATPRVESGALYDWFEAFGVRIYVW